MIRKLSFLIWFMSIAVFVTVAQESCGEFVQQALDAANEFCSETGRNQACFGNVALDATPQPDAMNFQFSNLGDIVDVAAIQSMELSGLNQDAGTWGIVLMRVQANLPDTLPGQNVSILVFGDTEIRNAAASVAEQVPPEQEQSVSASTNVNVRQSPATNAGILGSISPNSAIIATGKTEDNQWIRIKYNEGIGWVSAELLSGGDLDALIVANPDTNLTGPMQAFYLTTGIGQPSCNEVPDDGILVQTPEGVGEISLNINEVQVNMASTVYFSVNDDRRLAVAPVEGAARITSNGRSRTAVAGTRVQIQLNDDYSPSGEPSEPESYKDEEDIQYLPIDPLERDIDIEEGLDDAEMDLFLQYDTVFNGINVEDVDEFFNYIDSEEDPDIANYLINDLGYTDFDDDLEAYFKDELGVDFSDYDSYLGDDYYGDGGEYGDEYDGGDEYGDEYGGDSYGDEYGDEYGGDSYGDEYGDEYGDDGYGD